mgnify:CR=1 FL=1
MYQALYRKYRSQTFGQLVGQEVVATTLRQAVEQDKISHAYLFSGPRGTGKTSVAKIFAKAMNCPNQKDGEPCNDCYICQAITEGSLEDVIEIDAASNNGVDEIRDIRDKSTYAPSLAKHKVYIIDEVHMLSSGAFNALLKTLEEPPSYVIFILATTEQSRIPVTVLSRCQRYDFRRITTDTIAARLAELAAAEHIRAEEAALRYIAAQADGAMRDALSLLDECVAFCPDGEIRYEAVLNILGAVDVEVFSKLFRALLYGKTGEALALLNRAFLEGRELGQFNADFLWYLRNLLVLKTAEHAEGLVDSAGERLQLLRADAELANKAVLLRAIRVQAELSQQLRYASDKRTLTELALIRLAEPEMDTDGDALLSRIARLEKRLQDVAKNGIPVAADITPAPAETEVAPENTARAEVKEIALSRPAYEDFMKVRSELGSIAESLGGMYAPALHSCELIAEESGKLTVCCPNEVTEGVLGKGGLDALRDCLRERYGKEFQLGLARKTGQTAARSYRMTEEELREQIHFPLEREE